ncbi:MAG: RAD55 family ATPase [Promethearchaeota archaeon]
MEKRYNAFGEDNLAVHLKAGSAMAEKEDLISTESPSINALLGGGLRRGTTCLIEEMYGESSGISGYLGFSFIRTGINSGENCILLLSEHTVDEYRVLPDIRQILSSAKSEQLVFIDALSSMAIEGPASVPDSKNGSVVVCANVRYAAKFYDELRSTFISMERPVVYIDSLSVLLAAMESDKTAWRFWVGLLPLVRQQKLTVLSSLYPQMHSSEFVESIERVSDTIIRFTSSPPLPRERQINYIQVVKHRGGHFDNKVYPYTRQQFKFQISHRTQLG